MTPYQVKKVSDEGSSSPFISRLFMGILSLRDDLFLMGVEGQQRQIMQDHFDQQFKPLYEAAQATRDAAVKVNQLVEAHLFAVNSGKAIQYRANQYDILETIDIPLSQAVDQLIDQSIIATKAGLQNILKDPLNFDIGFFFQNDKEFGNGINVLHTSGEDDLAQYLQDVRDNWHSSLQTLRVQHEHKGWSLDNLGYHLIAPSKVTVRLPTVLDSPVDEFVRKTANRVLLFIENMMVFALQRYGSQYPFSVVEIPREKRNQKDPKRFRLEPLGVSSLLPWVIAYHDDMDFV